MNDLIRFAAIAASVLLHVNVDLLSVRVRGRSVHQDPIALA